MAVRKWSRAFQWSKLYKALLFGPMQADGEVAQRLAE